MQWRWYPPVVFSLLYLLYEIESCEKLHPCFSSKKIFHAVLNQDLRCQPVSVCFGKFIQQALLQYVLVLCNDLSFVSLISVAHRVGYRTEAQHVCCVKAFFPHCLQFRQMHYLILHS